MDKVWGERVSGFTSKGVSVAPTIDLAKSQAIPV